MSLPQLHVYSRVLDADVILTESCADSLPPEAACCATFTYGELLLFKAQAKRPELRVAALAKRVLGGGWVVAIRSLRPRRRGWRSREVGYQAFVEASDDES